MMQTVIVIVILCVTVFFVIRAVVRMSKNKNGGCGCGCTNCPMKGSDCHCTEHERDNNE